MSQNKHNICGTEPASDAPQVDHPEDVASIDLLQKLRLASEEKSTRAKVRREDVDLELLQKLRLASDTAAIETDPDALARRKGLRESFDGYDRNKDGYVTYDEVEWAWMNCCRTVRSDSDDGRAIAEATNFMRNMNKATDEKITFEEYVDFFEKLWARRKK